MDRRTFILLSGASSGSLLVRLRESTGPGPEAPTGRLAFEFDDHHRWSLWYRGEGAPVPLLPFVAAGVRVGDRLVTLEDLDDASLQAGTPAIGESTIIRGRAAGLFVEATFRMEPSAPTPRAAVTIRIYPDTGQPNVSGIVWGALAVDRALPGPGELLLHTDGRAPEIHRMPPAPTTPDLRSSGMLALTRGARGTRRALGVVGEPGGAGTLAATLAGAVLTLDTPWTPPRNVSTGGDSAAITLAYDPHRDGLSALRIACAANEGDRAFLAKRTPPAGLWLEESAGQGDELTELAALAAATLDPRFAPFVCFGNEAAGPRGHRWRTDQVHGAGLLAAASIRPFAPPQDVNPAWVAGGVLDPANPEVSDFLRERARIAVQDWGYDALCLTDLEAVFSAPVHHDGATHLEALRAGLRALRDGAGAEHAFWSAELTPQTGTLEVVRVGADPVAGWSGAALNAKVAGLRSFYHRARWLNDPGPVTLGDPLSLVEARSRLGMVALGGGAALFNADVLGLPAEQLDLVRRTLPPAPVAGRPLDAVLAPTAGAPALLLGTTSVKLDGWRFRAEAGPGFAAPTLEDDDWEAIAGPARWRDLGHAGFSGEAWYRAKFTAPAAPAAAAPVLQLGRIDRADQTFVNGQLVGETGTIGLGTGADAQMARHYSLDPGVVRWGAENVVAIRVSGGLAGGIWSADDDAPPSLWTAAGPDGWWSVLVINWGARPVDRSVALADLDLPAGRYHAYDVWRGMPIPGTDPLRLSLDPHDSTVIGLRLRGEVPLVVGTTRHVIQGAVDLQDEHWDGKTRVLSGRAVNLDGRPYAVTVAARGFISDGLRGDRPGTVRAIDSEYLVLEWPGGERGDFGWELALQRTRTR